MLKKKVQLVMNNKYFGKSIGISAMWVFDFYAMNHDKITSDAISWIIFGSFIVTALAFEK